MTVAQPRDIIQAFRNSFEPRIAVTVDMISTGADIKPIEIVMFMRAVKSRVLFEQMKGRGVRVIDARELQAVTPDARAKTHFVIVDCVGVSDLPLADTQPLERKKTVAFKVLLEYVAMGGTDPAMLSSLASRLARLDRQCGPEERERIAEVSGGAGIGAISHAIVDGLDPDRQVAKARSMFDVPAGDEPTEQQVQQAATTLLKQAAEPISTRPALRRLLQDIKRKLEQVIDDISVDELIEAGASEEAKQKAKSLVDSFERFIADNRDEIDALQCFYAQPYTKRLRFGDLKTLADAIKAPPRAWTPEKLWRAYETLDKDRVRGASAQRLLTDLVSLVRFATDRDAELAPFGEHVRARFDQWLAHQHTASEVGKPAIWNDEVRDCCFQNTLIRVRAPEPLVPFLHLHFYKDALTGEFARAARGVGIHHLGAKTLSDWEVHLPPLDEQRRIVETVDSYFTRLDHVTGTLKQVRWNLKRYRTSILRPPSMEDLYPPRLSLHALTAVTTNLPRFCWSGASRNGASGGRTPS